MGQKVNPHGLRVGVIKDWDSKWYAEADFADLLTPQMPRPAPRAITSVCKTPTALLKNAII